MRGYREDVRLLIADEGFAVDTCTHWQVWDAPTWRGEVTAACGESVPVDQISGDPTCETCRQALARYEALEF